jgi:hypothetical protein
MIAAFHAYRPRHRDDYVTTDGCKNLNHGIGVSLCRIHHKNWLLGDYRPKHFGTPERFSCYPAGL